MQMAAIYARVSSEQQREAHTIASQTAALIEWARTFDLEVPKAWIVEDEGYSGATLERPGLERVRDLAAEGQIQAVLVYSPDRLSRKYAYQILLIEEFARHGVETRFLNAPPGATAEDQLLVQFQGMIAEYERRPNPRTLAAREASPRAGGRNQRVERRPVRLSLHPEE
jgi:site-specific DNA recombinase